ncbi:DNA alkylation repair protein [Ideonella sp. 4Y16]|uniref:DNA alkylation repair protein n=1 Tax=Ideonella alba TaxID=2824118 RepID=A0A940YDB9_9BURK|nr:DNA alkylation repair protein [Ideonella alba]MBQ0933523.1 DNA alkylation repair protein [Ideonella alba]MBQ0946499.1 DNA alkylation repair protein [Ideonella alba]
MQAHPRLADAMQRLQALARPDQLAGMARFGMTAEHRLGASVPSLRALGKDLGREHALALALHATGVPDAQILAAYVAEPRQFTVAEMNAWAARFIAWDTCDQACTNAFAPSPRAWARVPVWAADEREFVRRAGFALLAALAVHDKPAPDERFLAMLPLIEAHADDERNFVKKAVNWALRQIGKRQPTLLGPALDCAQRLKQRPERSARWIGSDAFRELIPRLERTR